jgi:hypothetical protein
LRNGIKIKAFTLLLAWLVIFVHGVIPHHHVDEDFSDCQNILQPAYQDVGHDNQADTYKRLPAEETVCHYSGLIFSHLNSDDQVFFSEAPIFLCPVGFFTQEIITTNFLIENDPQTGISFLRAPPYI